MHGLDDSAQTLMDSLAMIILKVLVDHVVKLLHRGQDELIEALLLDGPDKTLSEGICLRRQLHPVRTMQRERFASSIPSIPAMASSSRW